MSELLQKHEDLRRAANKAATEYENLEELSEQVLTDVILETLKKYQQRLNVGVEDSVTDLLDSFKHQIVETVFETAGAWQVAIRPPMLFPRGCRHCYVRGHSTVVVIEEEPKVRSLSFAANMLSGGRGGNARRASLALPYVVFVLHFRDDVFSGLHCGWRRHPLRSLDDILCRPLLPNIFDSLAVCMGHSGYAIGDNISQQCESVISNFWNSQFNEDLSEMWKAMQRHNSKLKTGEHWERESAVDSMFILESNFEECKSIQYIIDLLALNEETPDISTLRHTLTEQLDHCVSRLFSKIMRYFKKTKFEKHFPKDVEKQVKKALKESVGEFADLMKCLEHEINDLKSKVEPPAQTVQSQSQFWHKYSP